MKRLFYKICLLIVFGGLLACSGEEGIWQEEKGASIKLRFTDGVSRAADESIERAISHLDVFFFDASQGEIAESAIHERIQNPAVSGDNSQGMVKLTTPLSAFQERPDNYVYVIANAKDDLSGIKTLNALKSAIQEDERIHVSGLANVVGAPQFFLMDGRATAEGNAVSAINNAVKITSTSTDDVILDVTLKRAVAKVVVTLTEGANYKFLQDTKLNSAKGYYFRNMPYKTKIVENEASPYPDWENGNDYLRIPTPANDAAFVFGRNEVKVTAYVYSHSWGTSDGNNYHSRGTSLVVNIPLWKDLDGDQIIDKGDHGVADNEKQEKEYFENSFYQIPVVEASDNGNYYINRNTLYTITATINAPGAEDNKLPVTLDNLSYRTEPWGEDLVNVGGENSPKFLEVNQEVLEMHNVEEDATSLFFTSSSPVTITVGEAYYYNKYGVKISLDDTQKQASIPSPVWDRAALVGGITVKSNLPQNLTARYFTLKVQNQDDMSKTIRVIQYPVICVDNQLGWYSYRSDFYMDYENPEEDGRVSVKAVVGDNGSYVGNDYGTRPGYQGDSYFFASKVIAGAQSNGDYQSDFYAYNNVGTWWRPKYEFVYDECEVHNMRMYQIRVKSSSADYVVGIPRLDENGYTDRSAENEKLVSPSFMIASRLGAAIPTYGDLDLLHQGGSNKDDKTSGLYYDETSQTFKVGYLNGSIFVDGGTYNNNNDQLLKFFEDHCANYVEVVGNATNKKVYKDWRLPTAAEIIFIINNQGASGEDAASIDYLLNGGFYYSASGPVYNLKRMSNQTDKAIRCVHDIYTPELEISKKE